MTEGSVVENDKPDPLARVRERWIALPAQWIWKFGARVGSSSIRKINIFALVLGKPEVLAVVDGKVRKEVLEALVMAPEDVRLLLLRVGRMEHALRVIVDLAFVGAPDSLSFIRDTAKRVLEKEND